MACCSDYNGCPYSNNTAQQWLIWIVLIFAALYFYRYTMCQLKPKDRLELPTGLFSRQLTILLSGVDQSSVFSIFSHQCLMISLLYNLTFFQYKNTVARLNRGQAVCNKNRSPVF